MKQNEIINYLKNKDCYLNTDIIFESMYISFAFYLICFHCFCLLFVFLCTESESIYLYQYIYRLWALFLVFLYIYLYSIRDDCEYGGYADVDIDYNIFHLYQPACVESIEA